MSKANKKYSWQEIKRHAKLSDGWIVIKGRVYDVTKYMTDHPGGPEWIERYLGKDATAAYQTKENLGLEHSELANNLLKALLIGEVQDDQAK